MNKTVQFVLIAILVLPWIGVLVYFLTKKTRAKKYYSKLRQKYELTEEPAGKNIPVLSGLYRSRPIKVECGTNGSGNKISTLLSVACDNPNNFEFLLTRRGKPKKSAYSAGAHLIDDNEFDDKFVVQTNDLARVKRMFDFNTRFKLQQVCDLGFNGEIRLQGNSYSYIEPGFLKNDESVMRFELVLHELCDLADVMKYN